MDGLVDLLQTGCGLPHEDIFCTSVEGLGIRTGEEFKEALVTNLRDAALILLILSPNYYTRQFCIAEMGAAWALGSDVLPLVLPGVSRDPEVVMQGRQSVQLDEPGLDEFKTHLDKYWVGPRVARWNAKRGAFLRRVVDILAALPVPDVATRAEVENAVAEKVALEELLDENDVELRELRALVERLKDAKDAEEVAAIERDFSDAEDEFETLRRGAHSALSRLGSVEARCAFATLRGESWEPDQDDRQSFQKEIETSRQSGTIGLDSRERGLVSSEDHPRMKPIFSALRALGHFMDNSEEFGERVAPQIEAEREILVEIRNRDFWEELLDVTLLA